MALNMPCQMPFGLSVHPRGSHASLPQEAKTECAGESERVRVRFPNRMPSPHNPSAQFTPVEVGLYSMGSVVLNARCGGGSGSMLRRKPPAKSISSALTIVRTAANSISSAENPGPKSPCGAAQ